MSVRSAGLVRLVGIVVPSAACLAGCITYMPVEEYAFARAAVDAAVVVEAARYAPSSWFIAEQAFRNGEQAFKERRYSAAEDFFVTAKDEAEKAEWLARLERAKSGEY